MNILLQQSLIGQDTLEMLVIISHSTENYVPNYGKYDSSN